MRRMTQDDDPIEIPGLAQRRRRLISVVLVALSLVGAGVVARRHARAGDMASGLPRSETAATTSSTGSAGTPRGQDAPLSPVRNNSVASAPSAVPASIASTLKSESAMPSATRNLATAPTSARAHAPEVAPSRRPSPSRIVRDTPF
jgi:hypothetical protein